MRTQPLLVKIANEPPVTPADIALMEDGALYVFRTDPGSMPLYTYDNDSAGESECDGACAVAWPPVAAPAGATRVGEWSPIKRDDGSLQWAYRGKPVYTYAKDIQGKPTGDGVGGLWRAVKGVPAS